VIGVHEEQPPEEQPPVILLLLAALAISDKPDPAHFVVRAAPQVSITPARTLTIFAEHRGPLVESEYCVGVEIEFGDGQKSGQTQDCPPFAEYMEQLAHFERCNSQVVVCPPGFECSYNCVRPFDVRRSWTWRPADLRIGFGPGDHDISVTFFLPGGKRIVKRAHFLVAGFE